MFRFSSPCRRLLGFRLYLVLLLLFFILHIQNVYFYSYLRLIFAG
jgi:hypothetical protein